MCNTSVMLVGQKTRTMGESIILIQLRTLFISNHIRASKVCWEYSLSQMENNLHTRRLFEAFLVKLCIYLGYHVFVGVKQYAHPCLSNALIKKLKLFGFFLEISLCVDIFKKKSGSKVNL